MNSSISSLFEIFLRNPFVIVYLIAIYLASTKLMDKSAKAAKLIIAGCVVNIIVSFASQYLFMYIQESGFADSLGQHEVMLAYSFTSMILHAVGFFLILAAAFADREEKTNTQHPYQNQSVFR